MVVGRDGSNVSKHLPAFDAGNRVASVRRRLLSTHLHVEIVDDGLGGADLTGGTGVRGLVDRVPALGGELQVDSPLGHGTVVTAMIPIVADDADEIVGGAPTAS